MRIFMTCPTLRPHGGIRVILEWANRLAARGHEVTVRTDDRHECPWFPIAPAVRVQYDDRGLKTADCLVVCSPHAVGYLEGPGPDRRFAFMQMCEGLFRPSDRAWQALCRRFYLTPHPLILISRWNEAHVMSLGRFGPTHYVGNGVNLEHFPISHQPKDGRTVLVEGWVPGNPTKDRDRVAPRVAERLKAEGYRILAYSAERTTDRYARVPHEFHIRPPLAALNSLYERATILLKATKCDARACAPMEAMTKGTVTARAIEKGDDDLVDGENCLRTPYNEVALYKAAKRLLTDIPLRERLADNCRSYVQAHPWDGYIDQVEGILTGAEVTACTP